VGVAGPRASGADSRTVARRADGYFLPRFLPKQPCLTRSTAPKWLEYTACVPYHDWLELAHNPKVAGSNPAPAMKEKPRSGGVFSWGGKVRGAGQGSNRVPFALVVGFGVHPAEAVYGSAGSTPGAPIRGWLDTGGRAGECRGRLASPDSAFTAHAMRRLTVSTAVRHLPSEAGTITRLRLKRSRLGTHIRTKT
jgi:hypothetical protein